MKKLISYLLLILLCYNPLEAGWNEDFDQQTDLLVANFPDLQNADYQKEIVFFRAVRSELLKDKALIEKVRQAQPGEKVHVHKKTFSVIIKKRRNNHIHEFFAWEISYFAGSNKYVLPSFPVEMGGARVIVQHLEQFEVGNMEGKGYSPGRIGKIPLTAYWKAHLQAYILGFGDLVAANIGINSQSHIRFFDNEASFIYYNSPFKTSLGFSSGFLCQSYDWPQYRAPLSDQAVSQLKTFVEKLENFEAKISDYLTFREVNISIDQLHFRLDKIKTFEVKQGVAFKDFFVWIYPKMAPGLDELNLIVSEILNKKVGHGTTLFFMSRLIKDYQLSNRQQQKITHWINRYID